MLAVKLLVGAVGRALVLFGCQAPLSQHSTLRRAWRRFPTTSH
jgi:hypothetical protein